MKWNTEERKKKDGRNMKGMGTGIRQMGEHLEEGETPAVRLQLQEGETPEAMQLTKMHWVNGQQLATEICVRDRVQQLCRKGKMVVKLAQCRLLILLAL